MKLIIGLGNLGEKYEKTRHNLGFMAVDHVLKDYEPVNKTVWEENTKLKSDIALFDWQRKSGAVERVILTKPKTFMNNSGQAIKLLAAYYKLQTTDIWVIHDDVDLPLGSIRIRTGGSSGGHRGVQSAIEQLGDEKFVRFRLGIGHPHRDSNTHLPGKSFVKDVDEFVLGGFTSAEKGKIKDLLKSTSKALQMALEEDLQAAMNRYNTK